MPRARRVPTPSRSRRGVAMALRAAAARTGPRRAPRAVVGLPPEQIKHDRDVTYGRARAEVEPPHTSARVSQSRAAAGTVARRAGRDADTRLDGGAAAEEGGTGATRRRRRLIVRPRRRSSHTCRRRASAMSPPRRAAGSDGRAVDAPGLSACGTILGERRSPPSRAPAGSPYDVGPRRRGCDDEEVEYDEGEFADEAEDDGFDVHRLRRRLRRLRSISDESGAERWRALFSRAYAPSARRRGAPSTHADARAGGRPTSTTDEYDDDDDDAAGLGRSLRRAGDGASTPAEPPPSIPHTCP